MANWSNRFTKPLDEIAKAFNSSIGVDKEMVEEDIEGSIAHVTMLSETGILSCEEKQEIIEGLLEIWEEIRNGTLVIDEHSEDIHFFIEEKLTERIPHSGKKLHTARSRNDQVVTDLRLFVKRRLVKINRTLQSLIETLADTSKQHLTTVCPGYTHLQRAQPVTLAHHLMAYAQMFLRDLKRIQDAISRMDECPLGAGALATTTYPIDRFRTSELLGFDRPMRNSMDAVSDRDFVLETEFCLTMAMMHLSRLSEELIIWSSSEFSMIELDDSLSTGSSIMPQKKNPDMAELIRGKAGTMTGILVGYLSTMKGLSLSYNKDLQEDKKGLFEGLEMVNDALVVMEKLIETMTVHREAMALKVQSGYLEATDIADYLVRKGLPFREAYQIVGGLVLEAKTQNIDFQDMTLSDFTRHSSLFERDVFEEIRPIEMVKRRSVYGGPAPEAVQQQIAETLDELKTCFKDESSL